MRRTNSDQNLRKLLDDVKPEQWPENVLSDKMVLVQILKSSGYYLVRHAENKPEELAPFVLVIEIS